MENQEIHTPIESHKAPQKPEPTTEHAMSRRGFLGAIGVITAAAATGVLTNGCCKKDEQKTGEPAATELEQKTEKPAELRKLSPEQEKEMIQLLKARSEAEKNKNLCPNLDWSRAERALTPEVLLTVYKAEREKHEPTIYFSDETGFDIGTRTGETPQSTRNCVYDEKAAEWVKKHYPNEQFNGSAEEQAEAMGWELMTTDQGRHIAKNTELYYEQDWSYYDTPEDVRKAGGAIYGDRSGYRLDVFQRDAYDRSVNRGWRGTLRVNFVD